MPYVSQEERERERDRAEWIGLADLLHWIRAAEGCLAEDAKTQITDALVDGAVRLRWEPLPKESAYSTGSGVHIPNVGPPGKTDYWRTVKLDWLRGAVWDDFKKQEYLTIKQDWDDGDYDCAPPIDRSRDPVWRNLLFDRGECEKIWPSRTRSKTGPDRAIREHAKSKFREFIKINGLDVFKKMKQISLAELGGCNREPAEAGRKELLAEFEG